MSGSPSYLTPFGNGFYPAGSNAWSGTAQSVQPAQPYVIPGTPFAAQYINWLFQQITNQVGTVQDYANVAPVNWHVFGSVDSGSSLVADMKWDGFKGRWVACTVNPMSSTSHAKTSIDGGRTWTALGTGTNAYNGNAYVFVSNVNGSIFTFDVPAGHQFTLSGTTWTSHSPTVFASVSYLTFFEMDGGAVGIGAVQSSGHYLGSFAWGASSTLYMAGTWVDERLTLPAVLQANTTGTVQQMVSVVTPNGGDALVGFCGTPGGGDISRLAHFVSAGSGAPPTVTDATPTFLSGTGQALLSVGYDSSNLLWSILYTNGTSTTLTTTPDFIIWTTRQVWNIAQTPVMHTVCGSTYVVIFEAGLHGGAQCFVSTGTPTDWQVASNFSWDTSGAGGVTGVNTLGVTNNGSQFLGWNTLSVMPSETQGLTYINGTF